MSNQTLGMLILLGFFPAYAAIGHFTSWLWFRDGNRVQEWIDTQISASTIRKVERHLDREDQS